MKRDPTLNNLGKLLQDICREGLEQMWYVELSAVKKVKFEKACDDPDLFSLPLHLIMFKVPRTMEFIQLVLEILKD